MWDVFISHAWEDKEAIARPIANALSQAGVSVWYDEFTLTLGDSLRRSIDHGLAESRYGIVILSPHFFAKDWPQRELDGLIAKEISAGKTILPVWHNVTREDVVRCSPMLGDRIGVSTKSGLNTVVQEILRALHKSVSLDQSDTRNSTKPDPSLVTIHQKTPSSIKPSRKFDLSNLQQLIDYAYSTSGINLSRQEAAMWAESHLELISTYGFDKFKELADYAYSTSGINLSRREAAKWAENHLELISMNSFKEFKELADYAYSITGLNLSKREAADWAIRQLRSNSA